MQNIQESGNLGNVQTKSGFVIPISFYWKFHINYEKFYKFCRTFFHKRLYLQLLNSAINFTKLFFSVYTKKKSLLHLLSL